MKNPANEQELVGFELAIQRQQLTRALYWKNRQLDELTHSAELVELQAEIDAIIAALKNMDA